MRSWRWYFKVLFALLVAAFAYWVWPTPWQTEKVRGDTMRVNRVTGAAQVLRVYGWDDVWRPLPGGPEGPQGDRAAEAISIVKEEPAERWFAEPHYAESVEDWLRRMGQETKGYHGVMKWSAEKQADGLYIVYFRVQPPSAKTPGLGWEVDVENRVVRYINDDSGLRKHYGFPSQRRNVFEGAP